MGWLESGRGRVGEEGGGGESRLARCMKGLRA